MANDTDWRQVRHPDAAVILVYFGVVDVEVVHCVLEGWLIELLFPTELVKG